MICSSVNLLRFMSVSFAGEQTNPKVRTFQGSRSRSLKYECVYLHAFETGSEARAGVGKRIAYYNAERPHSALGGRTPLEAHTGVETIKLAA
jgi:transposase InsO family protein